MRLHKGFAFFMCVLLGLTASSVGTPAAGAAAPYTIDVNETEPITDGALIGGTNYLPLKTAARKLGYHVEWSQQNHNVLLYIPGRRIEIQTETGEVKVDGKRYPVENKSILVRSGTTMITAKRLAQITGSLLSNPPLRKIPILRICITGIIFI